MSDVPESIVEKVKKLLNLSKSSNPHEAATTAAIANKLILKYQLDKIKLEQDNAAPATLEIESKVIYSTKKMTHWRFLLLSRLATNFNCRVINFEDRSGRLVNNFTVFGTKEDIEIVQENFNWFSLVVEVFSKSFCKGKGYAASQSYCQGVVDGIASQLTKSKKEIISEFNDEKAITILDNKSKTVDDFISKNHKIYSHKYDRKGEFDKDFYSNGLRDGKSINPNINTKVLK